MPEYFRPALSLGNGQLRPILAEVPLALLIMKNRLGHPAPPTAIREANGMAMECPEDQGIQDRLMSSRCSKVADFSSRYCANTPLEFKVAQCVPAFANSLFPGMRNVELERLATENLIAEGVALLIDSTKTNKRRLIEMLSALAAWLKAYPTGESGAATGALHSKMLELALATAEARLDLARALGLGELAEERGDEVVPAAKSLGTPLAASLTDEFGDAVTAAKRKRPAEETRGGHVHRLPSCSECDWFFIHHDPIRSVRGFSIR